MSLDCKSLSTAWSLFLASLSVSRFLMLGSAWLISFRVLFCSATGSLSMGMMTTSTFEYSFASSQRNGTTSLGFVGALSE